MDLAAALAAGGLALGLYGAYSQAESQKAQGASAVSQSLAAQQAAELNAQNIERQISAEAVNASLERRGLLMALERIQSTARAASGASGVTGGSARDIMEGNALEAAFALRTSFDREDYTRETLFRSAEIERLGGSSAVQRGRSTEAAAKRGALGNLIGGVGSSVLGYYSVGLRDRASATAGLVGATGLGTQLMGNFDFGGYV